MDPTINVLWNEEKRTWSVSARLRSGNATICTYTDGNLQRRMVVRQINMLCEDLMSRHVRLTAIPAAMERTALTRLQRAGLAMIVDHTEETTQ